MFRSASLFIGTSFTVAVFNIFATSHVDSIVGIPYKIYSMQRILIHTKSRSLCWMCPSAPRVCSKPGGKKPVLSLSLDLIGMMPSGGWRFGFAFNKAFHNSLFWSWCQRSVFVLKRCSLGLIQYKKSRHMAGNSPTADIRRWWDRPSPQWEFLNQLEIILLLGQYSDIDQAPGMNDMYEN